MTQYKPSDDGKVIDGKTVVWIYPPGAKGAGDAGPGAGDQAADGEHDAGEAGAGAAAGESAAAGASGGPGGSEAPAQTPGDKAAAKAAAQAETAKASAATLQAAAKDGVPFCEECEKARQELLKQAQEGEEAAPEAADAPEEKQPEKEEEKKDEPVTCSGTLKGPAGPLKNFPFQLLKDGQPVDPDKSITTKNGSRGKVWLTDGDGNYRFDGLPPGSYQVALFSPKGTLEPEPKAAKESGVRAPTPDDDLADADELRLFMDDDAGATDEA